MLRVHTIPRKKLFAPNWCLLDPPPCGIGSLDVIRKAITHGEEHLEGVRQETEDFWIGPKALDEKPTLDEWIGETRFALVLPPHKRGYCWRPGTLRENRRSDKPKRLWP